MTSQYLQKGPDGLLGALDLKTTGQNPNEFPRALQGTFETRPFYLLRNRRARAAGAAFAAINTAIVIETVPQDEVWHVNCLQITGTRNVADIGLTIESYIALRRNTGSVGGSVFTAIFGPVAATDLIQYRAQLCDLWLGPGDALRLHVGTTITAAATNYVLSFDYETMQSG